MAPLKKKIYNNFDRNFLITNFLRGKMSEELKILVSKKAAEGLQDGDVIGVGSGSTVAYFIKEISLMIKDGLRVDVVASSLESEKLLKENGVEIKDISEVETIDKYVDGADLVDDKLNLIKGLGAALFREKLLMGISDEVTIIIDESKLVASFIDFILPIEVVPFGAKKTQELLPFESSFRKDKDGKLLVTDNQNLVLDLKVDSVISLKELNIRIKMLTGVVETGLFVDDMPRVLVAQSDKSIKVIEGK